MNKPKLNVPYMVFTGATPERATELFRLKHRAEPEQVLEYKGMVWAGPIPKAPKRKEEDDD